jgi:hypothetical protein
MFNLNNLEEWKAMVKGYVCAYDNNKLRPPQYEEDIVEGPISSNYECIRNILFHYLTLLHT